MNKVSQRLSPDTPSYKPFEDINRDCMPNLKSRKQSIDAESKKSESDDEGLNKRFNFKFAENGNKNQACRKL